MSRTDDPDTLFPADDLSTSSASGGSASSAARTFDPARLTQARQLAGITKKVLADQVGVSAAAIGQYESGTRPGPEVLTALTKALGYPLTFFQIGRPYARLDSSAAHFRHLRETRAFQRAKAISFTEQTWELTYALERRVELPHVDLPGFAGGEITPGTALPTDPIQAARALRQHWRLGTGPIPHLTRTLETRGIVIIHAPADGDFKTVDAFSTSLLPRPFIIVSRDRTADVYRHRFTTAHELAHLVLHADAVPGDTKHEREANAFAAEFLTPRDTIVNTLPRRIDLAAFAELQRTWGASMHSLIYRCREVGLFSDATATRAYQRLNTTKTELEPVDGFPGEKPSLLRKAFELAETYGLTVHDLAAELHWPATRVRLLLGIADRRPTLDVIAGGRSAVTTRSDNSRVTRRHLSPAPSGEDGRRSTRR